MKYFYKNIVLDVPNSVYMPREDSELMVKCIKKMNLRRKNCLEIGCGSGLLSMIMAKKGAFVVAVDINAEAIKTTKNNAENNKLKINARVSDLFEKVVGVYDMIIFNPPYLPVEECETDANYAGGKTGRELIERFVKNVKSYLNDNGTILICISSITGEKEVIELFEKQHMKANVVSREKIPWEELIVIEAK